MDANQFSAVMQQHSAQQQQILAALQQQMQQQMQLQAAAAAAASPAASQQMHSPAPPRAKIPTAPSFSGNSPLALDEWLRAMRQQFGWYRYTADADKVAMAVAHLRGPALDWWDNQQAGAALDSLTASFVAFEAALRKRFQPVNSAMLARHALDALQQGSKQSVHDHIASFRRLLSAVPDMHESDRVHRFSKSLRPVFQAKVIQSNAKTLDEAITAATLAGALSQLASSSTTGGSSDAMELSMLGLEYDEEERPIAPAPPDAADTPVTRAEFRQLLAAMQRGSSSSSRGGKQSSSGQGGRRRQPRVHGLTDQEVRKRLDERLCFVCGEAGHRQYDCPQNKEKKSF